MTARREDILKKISAMGVHYISVDLNKLSDDTLEEVAEYLEKRKKRLMKKCLE